MNITTSEVVNSPVKIEFQIPIRAEQGEYIVTNISNGIGTYNIHQCIVIYIRNEEQKTHGLAHIDGHTEIESVKNFLDKFFDFANHQSLSLKSFQIPNVTLIGALEGEIKSGLNDAEFNLNKVKWLLDKHNITYTRLIDKFIDFTINETGSINNGFPINSISNCSTLHTIQQLKRKDAYMGTYPIIRGCDNSDTSIYLDERALLKLNNYNNFEKSDSESDTVMKFYNGGLSEFLDKGTKFLSSLKNDTFAKLENCIKKQSKSKNIELSNNLPLIIPENSQCSKNNYLLNAVLNNLDWRNNEFIINKENSRCTILEALKVVEKYDTNLTNVCLQKYFKEIYSRYDGHLFYKRYDADISAHKFFQGLEKCNSVLYILIVITSYEESSFIPFELTNQKVSYAIKIFNDINLSNLLTCIINRENAKYQYELDNININNYYTELKEVVQNRLGESFYQILSKRNTKILKFKLNQCKDYNDCYKEIKELLTSDCTQTKKCNATQWMKKVENELLTLAKESILSKFHDNDTQFHKLRDIYLKGFVQVKENMYNFD